MDIVKSSIFVMASAILGSSMAIASNIGSYTALHGFRPVVTLQGGYVSANVGNGAQSFSGTDSDMFTYTKSPGGKDIGFTGLFLGAEHLLPWVTYPGLFMQTGLEYNYFGNVGVRGTNTVGVEPQTSTTYQYGYNLQTQQVLGTFKLFATVYERFHIHGDVGLGAAFNRAGQYQTSTTETGSLNLTPGFGNQNKTQFSYSLGVGVDADVSNNIRLGLGYRYSDFGSSSLGNGTVTLNQYQYPVPFSLGRSHNYVNQFIAGISYVA